jgi:hypothetical protein
MKRLLLAAALGLVWACTPDIPNTPAASYITARFDPSASPAVVPAPNDLATGADGKLSVPVPAGASGADKAFYAWLDTLNGFPTVATATVTFDGNLAGASVTASSVKVIDLTLSNAAVTSSVAYADTGDTTAPGLVTVQPPTGGWTAGHRYAVAVVGGANGVKGADGRSVIASATWALLRAANPIVACDDLTSSTCQLKTELIPSTIVGDAAGRLADQLKTGRQLEALRRKYKPAVDAIVAGGVSRDDLALLWSFQIDSSLEFVFDPLAQKIPLPSDLLISNGKVTIPVDTSWPAAYQEFTRDYLNTLNGFPVASTATAAIAGGDLDPTTVTADTVQVLVLKGDPLSGAPTISYDSTTHQIIVAPKGGSWGKGRTIAIAVLGGDTGARAADNTNLVATSAWALARSASTLVDCVTLGADCHSVVTAAPLTDLQATGLEQLRRGYKPVLDALDANGVPRALVSGLWVFSTVDQPELTFDLASASPTIPYPNNAFLRASDDIDPTKKLTFPPGSGVTAPLFAGLNTLNGFSTTAPLISENSLTAAALDEDEIDPATLTATGFAKLSGTSTLTPVVTPCLNCASSTGTTPQPQQLQWVPQKPLDELTRYGAWVTTAMADSQARAVMASPSFALVRLANPLLDNGHSTVPVLSDALATALEPYRLKYKGCIDDIEAKGIARKNIALGFCFTTQSTAGVVKLLANTVANLPASALPDVPTLVADAPAVLSALGTAGYPVTHLSHIVLGNIVLPFGLNTATNTLNPVPSSWSARKAPFILTLPSGTMPSGGWPVVLFGHGLTRNRTDVYAIADSFATAGMATIAIDVVFHGDRADCAGSHTALGVSSDDAACADPTTQTCDANSGRCIAKDQANATACTSDVQCLMVGKGQCQFLGANAGKCEGGDFKRNASGVPVISAWNFLNLSNLFATRDNFRYSGSIDFTQVVRVLTSSSTGNLNQQLTAQGLDTVNGAALNYAGQSLGSFNGAVFAAANPAAAHVALNVAGSDQVQVLLTAPSFSAYRTAFVGGLASAGILEGTAAFDAFMVLAKTILDPADSQNMIYAAVNSSNTSRKVYIQYIQGDEVLPNPTTLELIGAAQQNASRQAQVYEFTEGTGAGFIPAAYPTSSRHGFLLSPANNPTCATPSLSCATVDGQYKVTTFLATGTAP